MSFPVVEATATYVEETGALTSLPVTLPSGIVPGNLLVLALRAATTSTATTPTGWTLLASRSNSGVTYIWYRIADGLEGATVTVTISSAVRTVANAYRIWGYSGLPEAVFAGSATVNPPSLAPSWGSADNLFLALMTSRTSDDTIDAAPTNYTDLITASNVSSSNTARVIMGSARRELAAASDDPDAFTVTGTTNSPHAATIVIKPGFTGTGASTLAGVTSAGSGTFIAPGTGASTLDGVTSAGIGFASSLPITADLILHLDASVLALADQDPVTTWNDLSLSGLVLVDGAFTPPTFVTPSLNGLGGVEFPSNNTALEDTSSVSLPGPRTIFLVVHTPPNDATWRYIHPQGAGLLIVKSTSSGKFVFGSDGGSGQFIEFTDVALTNADVLFTFVQQSTGAFVRADQVQKVSGNLSTLPSITTVHFGNTGGSAGSGGISFILHEVVMYDGVLSSGDIDLLEDYLFDKWFAGPTGVGASTLDGVTSAGTGVYTPPAITGTGASTLDGVTSAGSGTYTPAGITGTGASTLAGATSSGSGTFTGAITGTGSSILDGVTSAGTGTYTPAAITGTGASTLDGVTSAGVGNFIAAITGTGASTLAGVTSTGTGVFVSSAEVENVVCGVETAGAVCGVEAPAAQCRIGT